MYLDFDLNMSECQLKESKQKFYWICPNTTKKPKAKKNNQQLCVKS